MLRANDPDALARAAHAASAADMHMHAVIAHWAAGTLDDARSWSEHERVLEPARIAAVLLPAATFR
jgi:hypothetical protein